MSYLSEGRKLNISLAFIGQSYFAVPKNMRQNPLLLWKFQTNENFNKLFLIIHHILKDFMNLAKLYSFLVIDATLASDSLLRFRKNLSERI